MTDHTERYEVFIKSIAGFINKDLTSTIWSWRRLNAAGRVLVDGSSHASLEACFATVRRHSARFGAAPVKINLREPLQPAAPATPQFPVAQRGAMIAAVDRESARREALHARALALATIAALPTPGLRYAS
ncbi:MAG: hypothetical protein JWL96_3827 [Sphingomonas bacterium]|uniref:hypothetical protein n=1 Tax=Sphingomonas bacterium TaxID=1895847 RepID=UPI00260DD273|nr:hypothetical protein [Sphingomonas bacterium]MDB5711757.1 hypothetical protein [Sphingomonas bacterium]